MPTTAACAAIGAAACLFASPYLARLVVTVPDRACTAWWRGARATRQRQTVTAVTAVVLGALAGTAASTTAILPALIALALLTTPLVVIDIETHRLPDRLVLPAAISAGALLAIAAAVHRDWHPYLRSVEGAAAVFTVLFTITLISPRSFGFGDVKLGAILGAYLGWTGWATVYYGIFAGFVLGTVVAVVLLALGRAGRKTPIAFGPMLILGALSALALHATTSSL